jgi:tRNA threonylcarbamoyladenosine biosynthesis protein TsaB
MLLLGLDTAGTTLDLALADAGEIVVRRSFAERRGQSEALLPLLQSALRQAGREMRDIAAIAVVTGPGSFTGLRLGLAAAEGLSRALGCPVGGFDRFSLIRNHVKADKLAIILESLRAELFAEFESGQPLMLMAENIAARLDESWQLAGDGVSRLGKEGVSLPSGADMVALAAHDVLSRGDVLSPARPFYLRAPDVTLI